MCKLCTFFELVFPEVVDRVDDVDKDESEKYYLPSLELLESGVDFAHCVANSWH